MKISLQFHEFFDKFQNSNFHQNYLEQYLQVVIVDFMFGQRHLLVFFQVCFDPCYGELDLKSTAEGIERSKNSTTIVIMSF